MMTEHEQALHDHYASNAKARGHAESCDLVTTPRNWPTIIGRPRCTCDKGVSHSLQHCPACDRPEWHTNRTCDRCGRVRR